MSIIALTANALSGNRDACLEAGMTDYLVKPFNSLALLHVIATNLPPARAAARAEAGLFAPRAKRAG